MAEAVVSTVLDELDEVCARPLSRRARLLIRLASFALFFVAGIPLVMEVRRSDEYMCETLALLIKTHYIT